MKKTDLKTMAFDNANSNLIFGIDLGTTNSAIALRTNSSVPSLINLGFSNTMPSCVMWKDNKFIVGEIAYEERYKPNVIYSIKRIMGTDEKVTLIDGDNSITLSPSEVSAEILRELCRRAEIYYPKVKDVVITVPAYFNQKQIEATMLAGELADLNVKHILKEPTGAGYVYSKIESAESGELLIYDLGGGTFDVTHLMLLQKSEDTKQVMKNLEKFYDIDLHSRNSIDDSDQYYSRVLGVYGDSHLGGDDIDNLMVDLLLEKYAIPRGNLPKEDFERLKLECEQFKKSGLYSMDIRINGEKYLLDYDICVEATNRIYARTQTIMKPLMTASKHRNVKSIILVGGSTKSEIIRKRLQEDFPTASIVCALNPDETVAMGAASVAYDIAGNNAFKFQDVLPMAIGVLANEREISPCIPANTPIPYVCSVVYTTMYDWQSYLEIQLYQGVSTRPEDCIFLGTITVEDLPRKRKGELDVIIKFMLLIDGRLKVQAVVNDLVKEINIENIFSANSKNSFVKIEQDDFKDLFYQKAVNEGNEEAIRLFEERDKISPDNRTAIEEKILEAFL